MSRPAGAFPLPLPPTVIEHHGRSLFPPMKEWRSSSRVPPVLLITGIQGVGKREMAYFLAQWLLCERARFPGAPSDSDPLPCGECASCKKSLSASWVDFEEIRSVESEQTLKIEQFRRLKGQQGFGAHESRYRIILVADADRMTVQAANSLLKILEEPPPGWIFLLTASDSSLLLPTIVSRCQSVRLKPFSPLELEKVLDPGPGAPSERASLAIALSQGSWRKALEWMNEDAWKNRALILEFLKSPRTALSGLVDWAALEPANFERLLSQLESLALDLILWTLRGANHPWLNTDASAELSAQAQSRLKSSGSMLSAREWWVQRSEQIARARLVLSAPLNRKLLAQDVLLPWLAD